MADNGEQGESKEDKLNYLIDAVLMNAAVNATMLRFNSGGLADDPDRMREVIWREYECLKEMILKQYDDEEEEYNEN